MIYLGISDLPKRKAELLGSRLQKWNLLKEKSEFLCIVKGKKI